MRIGSADTASDVIVVAEIGNNHEGQYDLAEKMIGAAAEAGAHAVKFQTIVPEDLVHPSDAARLAQLGKFSFSRHQFEALAKRAQNEGVAFMSTPFSLTAVSWLADLVPAFKIASSDNTFYPLLSAVAQAGKPIVMSTGMTTESELIASVQYLRSKQVVELALLHCVSAYPARPEDAHLSTLGLLRSLADVVGYSDHVQGIEVAVASVMAGARIIEKHFTLDKNYSDFRDHQLSADPIEMRNLVEQTKRLNVLFGQPDVKVLLSEQATRDAARRSIVFKTDVQAGTKVQKDHLTWLRPGSGEGPEVTDAIIGRLLVVDVSEGDFLTWSMLQGVE